MRTSLAVIVVFTYGDQTSNLKFLFTKSVKSVWLASSDTATNPLNPSHGCVVFRLCNALVVCEHLQATVLNTQVNDREMCKRSEHSYRDVTYRSSNLPSIKSERKKTVQAVIRSQEQIQQRQATKALSIKNDKLIRQSQQRFTKCYRCIVGRASEVVTSKKQLMTNWKREGNSANVDLLGFQWISSFYNNSHKGKTILAAVY